MKHSWKSIVRVDFGWRLTSTSSDKEMIDAEGADENGDNLISEEEFDAWLAWMRDLEIQEMRLLMLQLFSVLTDLVTFDILSHDLQERERCLMIMPHVGGKGDGFPFTDVVAAFFGHATPVKSGGCIWWCHDMVVIYYFSLSYTS